jgi:hypothetical protein
MVEGNETVHSHSLAGLVFRLRLPVRDSDCTREILGMNPFHCVLVLIVCFSFSNCSLPSIPLDYLVCAVQGGFRSMGQENQNHAKGAQGDRRAKIQVRSFTRARLSRGTDSAAYLLRHLSTVHVFLN